MNLLLWVPGKNDDDDDALEDALLYRSFSRSWERTVTATVPVLFYFRIDVSHRLPPPQSRDGQNQ